MYRRFMNAREVVKVKNKAPIGVGKRRLRVLEQYLTKRNIAKFLNS